MQEFDDVELITRRAEFGEATDSLGANTFVPSVHVEDYLQRVDEGRPAPEG